MSSSIDAASSSSWRPASAALRMRSAQPSARRTGTRCTGSGWWLSQNARMRSRAVIVPSKSPVKHAMPTRSARTESITLKGSCCWKWISASASQRDASRYRRAQEVQAREREGRKSAGGVIVGSHGVVHDAAHVSLDLVPPVARLERDQAQGGERSRVAEVAHRYRWPRGERRRRCRVALPGQER